MTPASKGAQVKRAPASRPAPATASRAGNKKTSAKVDATATKRPAPTKKKAAPVVKKAVTAAKKPASSANKSTARAQEGRDGDGQEGGDDQQGGPAGEEGDARRQEGRARQEGQPGSGRDEEGGRQARRQEGRFGSKVAAGNGAAAVVAPARTTFTPKPKAPPPVRPKTGPYAKDTKFLDEVRELLVADRAIYQEQATSLRAEADSLALEREPGDVQFDEESGEGGTVTVDRERNLALSGQASLAVEEIDDALKRIDDKTYGYCERCFQPIPKPRLRALPYARLCVACKSGGLSRR